MPRRPIRVELQVVVAPRDSQADLEHRDSEEQRRDQQGAVLKLALHSHEAVTIGDLDAHDDVQGHDAQEGPVGGGGHLLDPTALNAS